MSRSNTPLDYVHSFLDLVILIDPNEYHYIPDLKLVVLESLPGWQARLGFTQHPTTKDSRKLAVFKMGLSMRVL